MTLLHYLKETPTKELNRALNSNKEYLFFNISAFNIGISIFIKCTNIYKDINQNNWNGYDFWLENDNTTNYYIQQELNNRKK